MVKPIRASLMISDVQLSLLHGLAFALFYTSMGIPIGRLVDRYRRTYIVAIGIAIWSVATALCGFGTLRGDVRRTRAGRHRRIAVVADRLFGPWQLVFLLAGLPGLLIALLVVTLHGPARHGAGADIAMPSSPAVLPHRRERICAYGLLILGLCLQSIMWNGATF